MFDFARWPESLEEIAAQLHVSANTVKAHLPAIYAKLEVCTRRDAVTRGRIVVDGVR